MQTNRHTMAMPLLLAVVMITIGGLGAAEAQTPLFNTERLQAIEGAPAEIALPEGLTAMRYRPVGVDPRFANEAAVAIGERIILDLFPDVSYEAVVDRTDRNINGTVTVRARLEGYQFGYLLISTTNGQSLGTIKVPERQEKYTVIESAAGDGHYLIDIAGRVDIPHSPPLIPPPPTEEELKEIEILQSRVAAQKQGPEDPATIDVMIVYTPAAAGAVNIVNAMAQAMGRAQLSLDNSLTYVQMVLVHSAQVDYTESGDSGVDLRRITASPTFNPFGNYYAGHWIPGFMDEVHEWRNEYNADLVALFSIPNDTGGVAWLLSSPSGSPNWAFSLTGAQFAANSYTHIHEMGHNMGCHHHKEQNFQPGPGLFSYSAGWRWVGSQRYCSLMTYGSGQYFPDGLNHTPVAHFSNPSVNHQGVPTGHAADGDNARTIREVKHVVAAYRYSPPIGDLAVSNVQAMQVPGTKLVDVTYDLQTEEDMPVTVSLFLSTDGGVTYPHLCQHVTGAVGEGILSGIGLKIMWDAGLDYPDLSSATCRLRVVADESQYRDRFLFLPPGTFTMGSPSDEPGRYANEGPQHEVTLTKGFYVTTHAVTEEWWHEVMGGTATNPQMPKNGVSWDAVVVFCNTLSMQEGLVPAYTILGPNGDVTWNQDANGYRLPTEAEWEYACRAGSTTAFTNGPITHQFCEPLDPNLDAVGWYCGNSGNARQLVGQKQANAWGLYDTHGNVAEWVWCSQRGYTSDPQVDPVFSAGSGRIVRGGNWTAIARQCRSAYRLVRGANGEFPENGFRLVRSAP